MFSLLLLGAGAVLFSVPFLSALFIFFFFFLFPFPFPFPFRSLDFFSLKGNGATPYRSAVVASLLKQNPSVVRGNPSEILACAAQLGVDDICVDNASEQQQKQKGADSLVDSTAVDLAVVDAMARAIGGVVVMTGSVDYVTDGGSNRYRICHDVPELQAITATGCSLSSLIAAFVGACDTHNAESHARAAAHACAYFTLAAERAALELRNSNSTAGRFQFSDSQFSKQASVGSGSMRVAMLDSLGALDEDAMRALARIEIV